MASQSPAPAGLWPFRGRSDQAAFAAGAQACDNRPLPWRRRAPPPPMSS